MSVESEIEAVPTNEQTRVAIICIARMLEYLNKQLGILCEILEDLTVEVIKIREKVAK